MLLTSCRIWWTPSAIGWRRQIIHRGVGEVLICRWGHGRKGIGFGGLGRVLRRWRPHTQESTGAIHADVVHGRGEDLAPIVAEIALRAGNKRLRDLGELLRGWDGAYSVDSIAATVFTTFWEHWVRRVVRVRFPNHVAQLVVGRGGSVARQVLTGQALGWTPDDGIWIGRCMRHWTTRWIGCAAAWGRESRSGAGGVCIL